MERISRDRRHPSRRRPRSRGAPAHSTGVVAGLGGPLRVALPARALRRGGTIVPERFDEYMDGEGVDVAILFCEYSPKSTGIQPVEDLVPILSHNPTRFRLMANLNPHFHYPLVDELRRQISLGAVGLKLHPVHGSFSPNDRMLYPAYAFSEAEGYARGLPLRHERLPRLDQPLRRSRPYRGRRA